MQAIVVAVRTKLSAGPTVTRSQKLFLNLLAIEVDDIEVAIQHTRFVGEVVNLLLGFVNKLNFIHFPFAVRQLFGFATEDHFVDVVEAVALRSDNHGVVIGKEIVVVSNV